MKNICDICLVNKKSKNCANGHTVCDFCYKTQNKCPFCRISYAFTEFCITDGSHHDEIEFLEKTNINILLEKISNHYFVIDVATRNQNIFGKYFG